MPFLPALQAIILQPALQLGLAADKNTLLQGQHVALRQEPGVNLLVGGKRAGALGGVQRHMAAAVL